MGVMYDNCFKCGKVTSWNDRGITFCSDCKERQAKLDLFIKENGLMTLEELSEKTKDNLKPAYEARTKVRSFSTENTLFDIMAWDHGRFFLIVMARNGDIVNISGSYDGNVASLHIGDIELEDFTIIYK